MTICQWCHTDVDAVPKHATTMTQDGEVVHVVCLVTAKGYMEAISGDVRILVEAPEDASEKT